MLWTIETYPDSSFSIPHFDNSPRWSMSKDVKCTFLGSRHFFRSNAPMSILVGKNCQVLLFRVFQDFSIAWSVSVWNLYSTMTMTMVCVLDATAACICMIQKDWGWFIIWNVQQICFRIPSWNHQWNLLLWMAEMVLILYFIIFNRCSSKTQGPEIQLGDVIISQKTMFEPQVFKHAVTR